MGKVLEIDLTSEGIGEYRVSDSEREMFLGGRILSTKILWDVLEPGLDPLSAGNVLVVMTSPLAGTGAPSSCRYDISAKSPLTGGIGHSNSGGHFGFFLKRAGWDGIVIRGRASRPVYIEIEEEQVSIKDAGHLWGKDTQSAQRAMGRGGTLAIGPGGENQVRFATVASQERAHGRTGMGAVMGSKNLKGIVARGKSKIETAHPGPFKDLVKKWIALLMNHPATGDFTPKYGTAGFMTKLSERHALPTKNFSKGHYQDAYQIGGERLRSDFLTGRSGCISCPIRCGRVVTLRGQEIKGPEYETLCMLGANLLVNDLEAIIHWNRQLDLLGIDTVSAGNVLAFAAELNEKGLWKNGIEFGKKENISGILDDIAYRRGLGAELAEGVRTLSERYGGEEFAAHAKGLELAAYEPRGAVGHGLGYATAPRGGCHLDGGYLVYFEVLGPLTLKPRHIRSKPGWVVFDQNLLAAMSAGGTCLFTAWTFVPGLAYRLQGHKMLSSILGGLLTYSWPFIDGIVKMPKSLMKVHLSLLPHTKAMELATGMKMDLGLFYEVGERGYALERLFNIREGIGPDQDRLPKRFTRERLLPEKKGSRVPLEKMLPKYYHLRGWDEKGIPTKRTLKRLKLDFALAP